MRAHRVRALLMGGQACVFYGAAEFSRDTDLEANYFSARLAPTAERVAFWIRELRTPELLVEAVRYHREAAEADIERRPLLASALRGDLDALAAGLDEEQRREQAADRAYWAPLRRELELLRRAGRAGAAEDA